MEKHQGYKGGLQSNGSTGKNAVYYADTSTELIFHVSTKFNHDEENANVKSKPNLFNILLLHMYTI